MSNKIVRSRFVGFVRGSAGVLLERTDYLMRVSVAPRSTRWQIWWANGEVECFPTLKGAERRFNSSAM